jgi:hypothetical protein
MYFYKQIVQFFHSLTLAVILVRPRLTNKLTIEKMEMQKFDETFIQILGALKNEKVTKGVFNFINLNR